jgi:hypothetical protein
VFTDDDFVYIPRGYIHTLDAFLNEHSIPFEIVDRSVSFDFIESLQTPKRKYNDQKLITAYLGEILHTVPGAYAQDENEQSAINPQLSVTVLKSDFSIPYEIASKDFAHLHKLLSFDTNRNALIAEAIKEEVSKKDTAHIAKNGKVPFPYLLQPFFSETTSFRRNPRTAFQETGVLLGV